MRLEFAVRALVAATCAALTSACVVGPDYHSPDLALPGQWSAITRPSMREKPALAAWWKRFDDPLLTQLVEEAVAGNLDVAAAAARIREARAVRDEAAAALLPTLDASASAVRSRSAAITPSLPGTQSNLFKAGFDASWDLDLFGGNARNLEAKAYGVEAADEDLRATLLTLVGDVARYYIDARGYQARIALAQRSAASQRQTAELVQKQFDIGTASGADAAKARAQALSTEADIPALDSSYRETVHRLGVLLGIGPTAALDRMKKPRAIPVPAIHVAVGIPADVVRGRPDIRKAERQLAQETAGIGVAEAELYPKVTLDGSIGVSAFQLGNLTKSSAQTWSFGPSLSAPIFDGGRRLAAISQQEAVRDRYFVALKATILQAMEEVENGIVSLRNQKIENERLARSTSSYREAARIARALYERGSTSFIDELDAERSLYSSQDTLLRNEVLLAERYIALFKALGGGWSGRIEVTQPQIVVRSSGSRPRL